MIDIKADDKICVTKPFNFAERFVGNVGDVWRVIRTNEFFTHITNDNVRFSVNNSAFIRHFEKI